MLRGSASPSKVTGIQVNAQGAAQNFGQNAFSRTSQQIFRDAGITAQYLWTISANKINELRFQYARRGLLYTYSPDPTGGNAAVNIPGVAFIRRGPFRFVRPAAQRDQLTRRFLWVRGPHEMYFGAHVT